MAFKDCLIGSALVVGGTSLYTGIAAGLGAASGAIGWSILRAAGWTGVKFGYYELMGANALGSALLSVFPGLCIMTCLVAASEEGTNQVGGSATGGSLVGYSLVGALTAMLGSAILGYLDEREQIGFSAAAGATGNLVLGAGLGTLGCILACCCGVTYLCFKGASDEVVIAKVPPKYLNKDGTLKEGVLSMKDLEKAEPQQVVTLTAANPQWDDFVERVSTHIGKDKEQNAPLQLKPN
jgi:hypothetical protein